MGWSLYLMPLLGKNVFFILALSDRNIFPQSITESQHKWNKFRFLNMKWAIAAQTNQTVWKYSANKLNVSSCWRSKTGCCPKGFYSFIIQNVGRNSNTNQPILYSYLIRSNFHLYWYFLSIVLAALVRVLEIMGFNVKAEFLIKHFFLFVSWSKSNFGDPWMNIFLMKTDPSCSTWYNEKCKQNC